MRFSRTLSVGQYQGLLLGLMAAAGAVKGGAILWQTTFDGWPLLHVLALPVGVAGLAIGLGAGHSRVVSARIARRLPLPGGLFLILPLAAGTHVGLTTGVQVWTVLAPVGFAFLALPLSHPDVTSIQLSPSEPAEPPSPPVRK